ncbi:MAG: DUF3348 family protein [Rhodoferax sp.]|nr:DUF3348 family protein [Rhodoferax sp.]
MTRALTRTSFHSARLIHVLADLSLLDKAAQGAAFAEKLGTWVRFTDAITLSAVHNANPASQPGLPVGLRADAHSELGKTLARVQAGLVSSMDRAQAELPAPEADALTDPTAGFEPYRRHYLAQQREIELKLRALRAQVRQVLGQSSARLRKLVALDAAFEGILAERESKLLLKLPVLLEKRFKQLAQVQPQTHTWLTGFCREMQAVLLAELELRMQPVLGLMEACHQDSTTG